MTVDEAPHAVCPHCGEKFTKLDKAGKIPAHDFPRPCRSVCPGSKEEPRSPTDTRPLWKDNATQRGKDFFDRARMELLLYGFACVKQMAIYTGLVRGVVKCPLCLHNVSFAIAESNGHCAARCETDKCINARE